MVSNKEIKERLNYKKKGLDPKTESKKNRILEKSKKFSNKRICQSCGYRNPHTAEFCIECGEKMPKFTLPFADASEYDEDNGRNEDKVLLPFADIMLEHAELPEIKKNENKITTDEEKFADKSPTLDEFNETNPEIIEDKSEVTLQISPLDEIKKAKELLEIGAITEEEFQIIKNKYLEKI